MIDVEIVISIEAGNVDVGASGTVGLQYLGTEPDLIVGQNIAFVNHVFAEITQNVDTDIIVRSVVTGCLVSNLIGDLHGLAQNDGIGIDSLTPAGKVPFHVRRLTEFLVGQLGSGHACAGQECC